MVTAVVFDRGALVKERTGEEVLYEILHPLGLGVSKEALTKAQAASRAYWGENYKGKPKGERWNRTIRRECLSAALFSLGVKQEGEEVLDRLDEFWDAFRLQDLQTGARPCLAALAGARLPMGLLAQSLRNSTEIRSEMERLGIGRYFFLVLSAEEAPWDKPDPRLYDLMAQRMQCIPTEIVLVGTNFETDAEGARTAGMTPVLIDRKGTGPKDGVAVLHSLIELPGFVSNLAQAPPAGDPSGPPKDPPPPGGE